MNVNRKHLSFCRVVGWLLHALKLCCAVLHPPTNQKLCLETLSGNDTFYRAHFFVFFVYDSWYFFPPVPSILNGRVEEWVAGSWRTIPYFPSRWAVLNVRIERVEMYIILLSLWFIFSLKIGARDLLPNWGSFFYHHPLSIINSQEIYLLRCTVF